MMLTHVRDVSGLSDTLETTEDGKSPNVTLKEEIESLTERLKEAENEIER